MYLYKTQIIKNPNGTQSEIDAIVAEKNDFETNFKAMATPVSGVVIAETTFVTDLSYANFKAKIVSPILWSDVKYIEDIVKYILHVTSSVPL